MRKEINIPSRNDSTLSLLSPYGFYEILAFVGSLHVHQMFQHVLPYNSNMRQTIKMFGGNSC
jgi:hypothetical protein